MSTEKYEKKSKISKDSIEAEELAEKIKVLFGFCVTLIPHKTMLGQLVKTTESRSSFTMDAAPILTAFGHDWEEKHFEAELYRKRAKALYNLICTLDATEKERIEWNSKQAARAQGRAEIARILGL